MTTAILLLLIFGLTTGLMISMRKLGNCKERCRSLEASNDIKSRQLEAAVNRLDPADAASLLDEGSF